MPGSSAGPGPLAFLSVLALTLGVAWHARQHVALPEPPPDLSARLQGQLIPDALPEGPPGTSHPERFAPMEPTQYGAADLPGLDFSGLDPLAQEQALLALNHSLGPCQTCLEKGWTLARCALEPAPGCTGGQKLADRALRLAAAGWEAERIRQNVERPDIYQDIPPEAGLPWLGSEAAPVQVLLAVQLDSPFAAPALDLWRALQRQYGDKLAVRILPLRPRGRSGERFTRELVASGSLGELPGLLTLLPASDGQLRADVYARAGLDADAMRAQLEQVEPEVTALSAQQDQLGVHNTPTAFVNGVRARGLQSEQALIRLIEDELAAVAP